MSKSNRVEFKTADGVTLRGDFYRADGDNRPVILMTAGLNLLKEHGIVKIAEAFQAAGYSALAFDYRNYGSSDGMPRHESDMFQQAEDYRDAVTFAATLPGADPKKVVLWGVGHGGGDVIIAAADDPRPAAVLLQSPIISGRRDAGMWPKLLEKAWKDREAKSLAGDLSPTYVKAWPETAEEASDPNSGLVFGLGDFAFGLIQEHVARNKETGTPWENKITLRSLLHTARTEPKDFIYKIKQPTFYVVFPEDPFTGTSDWHRTAFDLMGPNAEFHIVQPPAEFTTFEAFLAEAAPSQIEFLKRTLK